MKILVLSDSHREMENMHKAVLRENPDMIFHLGDHYKDAKLLHSEFDVKYLLHFIFFLKPFGFHLHFHV